MVVLFHDKEIIFVISFVLSQQRHVEIHAEQKELNKHVSVLIKQKRH